MPHDASSFLPLFARAADDTPPDPSPAPDVPPRALPPDPWDVPERAAAPPLHEPEPRIPLNDVQERAVTHLGSPLLILAGAGSGKTRVLTERIAWLIHEQGVRPWEICAFTFTNKAANEMKARIERRLGAAAADLWIGTFHRICTRILRRDGETIGIPRGFVIYDTDDQQSVLRRVIADLALPDGQFRPGAVGRAISDAKNRMVTADEYAETSYTPFAQGVARAYRAYQTRLHDAGALDFDDIILETLELFRRAPEVRERYARRFLHVLVDEYQDTNRAQYQLITALASGHRNLAVVGDDDQAIYSWRGADITNILSFEETYPDATVLRLEQNYRSTQRILDVAHAVVARIESRRDKKLWTTNAQGEPVHLLLTTDEETEGHLVADLVEEITERHALRRGQILVLYRTHAQSRAVEDGLRRAAIPYQLVGGVAFYERREVKDVLAYLRLLVNPRDDVAFARAVNTPKRGIGDTSVDRVRQFAASRGLSMLEALGHPDMPAALGTGAGKLMKFGAMIAEMRGMLDRAVPDLVRFVLDRSGYLTALTAEGEEAVARLENVEELVAAAAHSMEETGDPTLEGFLAEATLMSHADSLAGEEDRVVMMTVHTAKGLEYPAVIVTGVEEGLFPHITALDDPREMEEERRLFYVAVTRAERVVYLLAAGERRRFDRRMPCRLSRFVEDLPESLLETRDLGMRRHATRWNAPGWDAPETPRPRIERRDDGRVLIYEDGVDSGEVVEDSGAPRVGEAVEHKTFGRGVVVGREDAGGDTRLSIQFAQVGRKKVMARFVRRATD